MLETRIHLDSNGQDLAVEHIQDVEPILEFCKALRDIEQKSDWGRATHEIPNVAEIALLDEERAKGNTTLLYGSPEYNELFKKKIKSGDWECYRIDKPALIMGWLGFGS